MTAVHSFVQLAGICGLATLAVVIVGWGSLKAHRLQQQALRAYPLSTAMRRRFALRITGWFALMLIALGGELLVVLAFSAGGQSVWPLAVVLLCVAVFMLPFFAVSRYFNLWLLGKIQARNNPKRPQ